MAKLAINGGKAIAKSWKMPLWPRYDDSDKKALIETLESRSWCRIFDKSRAGVFERQFCRYHQAKYAVAVANGTVSLQLALKTLGVRPGDQVMVPAITFIASASAISDVGAVPVFVDSDPETFQVSADSVKEAITPRTRGLIGVHYGGYPIDFDRILPVLKKHKLFLVEDCAHAQGTEWKGRKVGAIGDIGSFSFQNSKAIASGEGGIITTDSEKLHQRAWLIHNIGRSSGKHGYSHYVLSSNYRLIEFAGALLSCQLKRFPKEARTRHQNGIWLEDRLAELGLIPLKRDRRITQRGYYFFVIRYKPENFGGLSREKFLAALNAEIPVCAGVAYGSPLYKNVAFRKENIRPLLPEKLFPEVPDYQGLRLPAAEQICREQIAMPHQLLLASRKELQLLVDAVEKIRGNAGELKG